METKTYSEAKITQFNAALAAITENNWQDIETSITNGTAKLGVLCVQFGVPADIFRSWLNQRWPNRLEFRRGPKGGIRFVKEQA